MTRKLLLAIGLMTLIGLTLLAHAAHSHEAVYPHHRDDLRKEEARLTVLLITAGFVLVLAGVFYIASRSEKRETQQARESEQGRLERAANEAARVGRTALLDQGTSEEAIRAALAAYAKVSGVAWNQNSVMVNGESIRCQIGGDVIVVRIFDQADQYGIEVNAARGETNAKSVLEMVRDA